MAAGPLDPAARARSGSLNVDGQRVAVAVSGGRDSIALLHCTARCARELGIEVVALHVHHGLLAAADDWLAQVRAQARRWGAGFVFRKLATTPAAGQSIEAWARRERYAALADMAADSGCGLVLLAHHRRDQAETWLLQALRGGGPAGLSAMPRQAHRKGLKWARPWLDMPRENIDAYMRRHRLRHVDDSSNADPRFARNRLRLDLWPALLRSFPDAETALTAAARQAVHAAALAAEVAELDLPPLLQADGLLVERWLELSPARRRNALHAWLRQRLPACPDTLLERLCTELRSRHNARWPAPAGEMRLYRGVLSVHTVGTLSGGTEGSASREVDTPAAASSLDLSRPGRTLLPGWQGSLQVAAVEQGGAPPWLLREVSATARQGGERIALAPGATARSLKKQFQARAIPAWQRAGPLLSTGDGRLLFVPGLGVDARLWAAPGQPQLGLQWCPDAAGTAADAAPGR